MYLDSQQLHYLIAFVLIITLVFIEDIDVLYNPFMIPILLLLFCFTLLFICKDNIGIGALLIGIVILVYVRLYSQRSFIPPFNTL
jgi:hypothetical protein